MAPRTLILPLVIVACAKTAVEPPSKAPTSDEEKALYALGTMYGKSVKPLDLSAADLELVKAGFEDVSLGKTPQVALDVYVPKAQSLAQARREAAEGKFAAVQKAKDAPFVAAAAKEAGARRLPTGVLLKTLTPGTGASPVIADRVRVRYEGKLTDGTPFDSNEKHGDHADLELTSVLPCWREALQQMKAGETAQLVCPPELAFGDEGKAPKVPGGATLVFKVELVQVNPPQPPPIPKHVPKMWPPKAAN